MNTNKTQIAHRTFTYTRPPSFCHPGGQAVFDVYVNDDGSVKLYPDTNPATLTREEWAKLVLLVETVELPKPENASDEPTDSPTVKAVESSDSVAIAAD